MTIYIRELEESKSIFFCLVLPPPNGKSFHYAYLKYRGGCWRKSDNARSHLDISMKAQQYKSCFGFLVFPFVAFCYNPSCNWIIFLFFLSSSSLFIFPIKITLWISLHHGIPKCKYKHSQHLLSTSHSLLSSSKIWLLVCY